MFAYRAIIGIIIIALVGGGIAIGAQIGAEGENGDVQALKERVLALEERLAANASDEAERRALIRQKSQEELLTDAVAKIAPSVVSVVVSKDVPKLEIVYENPFGDDPFFRDFGVQVPRIVQRGTEVQQVGAGSGFFVSANGHIATNRHVVADTEAIYTVVLSDGSQRQAQVIYRDPEIDFALLKVEGTGYPAVSLGNSDTLKLGQSVFAIGNALGEFSNSVSVGIISGLDRDLTAQGASGPEELHGIIQTDAAINVGNSGGPLADLNGNVIGINVAKAQGSENLGFSIPINVVKSMIASAT